MGYFESFIGVNFWTALFVLLNTIALYLVLKRFLFQPVLKIISDRQGEIDDMYKKAESARVEADQMRQDYQQKLDEATQTGQQLVADALKRGQEREAEIVSQANAQASAILDKAHSDIAQEKKKAMNDAKNEISDMAMAIAEKVVGRALNQEDQTRLVEQFIDELGESL